MTPAQRARQIDQEEFRRDSERALQRALAYSRQKQDARRRQFLIVAFGDQGKHMDLNRSYAPTDCTTTTQQTYKLGSRNLALTLNQWITRLGITDTALANKTAELGSMQSALEFFHEKLTAKSSRIATRYNCDGLSLTLDEWGDRLGVSVPALYARAKTLGTMQAAIRQGGSHRGRTSSTITHNSITMTRREWADHLGLTYDSLTQRIHKHGIHQALAMGGRKHGGRKAANQNTEPAPGVSRDFARSKENGAWSVLQETPNITFSQKAKSA